MIKALVQVGNDKGTNDTAGLVTAEPAGRLAVVDSMGRLAANPPGELMTVREAYIEMNVSRGTVDRLRQEGSLTSLYFNGRVRLLRSEVLAAKKWYSGMKGKV